MYQTQMEDAWTVAIGKHCSPCLLLFDWLLPTTSSANNESQVQLTTWHSMSVCPVAVHLQHLWAIAPSHSVAHQLNKTKWNGYCAKVQNYSTPPINSHSDSNPLPRSVCAKRTENKFTLLPVQIIAQRVYLGNLKTRLLAVFSRRRPINPIPANPSLKWRCSHSIRILSLSSLLAGCPDGWGPQQIDRFPENPCSWAWLISSQHSLSRYALIHHRVPFGTMLSWTDGLLFIWLSPQFISTAAACLKCHFLHDWNPTNVLILISGSSIIIVG